MPTTRRSSAGRGVVSTGKQSKLAFSNRVTKPVPKSVKDSVASSPLKKELIREKIDKQEVEDAQADELLLQEAELEVTKVEVTKSVAEIKAAKTSDAAIQKYWKKVEAERMAKRVHQEDLTTSEKVLRYFDVSSHYGVSHAYFSSDGGRLIANVAQPCIGMSRMKRWQRAQRLGLNPPIEVLAVLLKEEAKGNKGIERAHVDEIMNSTAVSHA